jgi:acyl carrier protein
MTRSEIFEKLKEVLKDSIDNDVNFDTITEDTRLIEDLGLNSVGIIFVVVSIEEAFNITFSDVGFNDFQNVKSVVDYIEKKVN